MHLPGAELFERLLDAVPAPVMVADLRGNILLVNRATERALGYRAGDAQGRLHVGDVYHRLEDARRVLARLRSRPAGAPADASEVTLRARNGELVPVRLTASLLHGPDGAPIGTLGVFEDQREIVSLTRRLEDAARQVEESERRAAGVASIGAVVHELAQPLTAAMGNVEMLLLEDTLPAPAKDRLRRTYEQLDRLRTYVNQLARSGRRSAPSEEVS
jgi:PAS domain S-box-containing protein